MRLASIRALGARRAAPLIIAFESQQETRVDRYALGPSETPFIVHKNVDGALHAHDELRQGNAGRALQAQARGEPGAGFVGRAEEKLVALGQHHHVLSLIHI